VVLSKNGGQYIPAGPVVDTGLIQHIKSIKLFPGPLKQLVLNDYGQGSGTRQWEEKVFRWDGTAMQMIWTWVRKALYKHWPPDLNGEIIGYAVRSDIFIDDPPGKAAKEIVTSSVDDRGVFCDDDNRSWELAKVTSHRETKVSHKWDESLFFYVAKSGKILSPEITVRCSREINGDESSDTLYAEMKVGILEIPGTALSKGEDYHAVAGKGHFC
jgi:hypothetical protein